VYFALLDSLRPGTLGKALSRLLVRTRRGHDPPHAGMALIRAALFGSLLGLGPVVANAILLSRAGEDLVYTEWDALQARVRWLLPLAWFVAGWLILFRTARAAGGVGRPGGVCAAGGKGGGARLRCRSRSGGGGTGGPPRALGCSSSSPPAAWISSFRRGSRSRSAWAVSPSAAS